MSKKNRLTLADLGMIVEDASFSMPEPADAILTNVPPGKGTDEALAGIDGGESKPGINWSPSMQDQPQDAPKDREAKEVEKAGSGIKAATGASGEQSSDVASDAGKQADAKDDGKPDFLKKKTEESFKLSAADIGLVLEDDENPFRDEADDGDPEDSSGGQQSGGQQGGQQSGGQQGGQQSGGQQAPAPQAGGQQGGQQDARLMDHNMGGGEIAVDLDLIKDILRAAVADQSDDAKIDLIVQAIVGCCGEDRTLTVADADAIMGKLKELSGGQQGGQQGAQMGGQQAPAPQAGGQQGQQGGAQMGGQQAPAMDSPEAVDAVPPGDGEVAGPEGGQQHEGKTKLMASIGESTKAKPGKKKKMTLSEAWIMGVPGVGIAACLGEAGGIGEDDEIDEDTLELRRMARKAGNPEWFNVGR